MQKGNTMSPRLIQSADFAIKLDDPRRNREHTAAFLAKGTKPFHLPHQTLGPGYEMRQSMRNDQIRLICEGETVYYVKLKQSNHVVPGVIHITQVGVWRTIDPRHEAAAHGLARALFNWLVDNYNVVISDNEQTGDGARFWRSRVLAAIDSPEQFVYSWDGTEEDAEPQPVTDAQTFIDSWSYFWGHKRDEHTHRLFIITSKPLQAAAC